VIPATATPDPPATLTRASHAALLAALLTAAGSSVGDNLQLLLAIPVTIAGFAVACLSARWIGLAVRQRSYRWIEIGLSVNAGIALSVGPPSGSARWYQVAYWIYWGAAVAIVGVASAGKPAARRRAVWVAVAFASLLYFVTPIAIPDARIDLWTWIDTCVRAMLRGVHPYTVRAGDPYGGAFDFGYAVSVFPYMPLVLIVNAPATAWLGDYRFGPALCLPVTIALLRSAGRRLFVDGRLIDAATLALALHPRGASIVALGWTEPWMVLALTLFVWRATYPRDESGQAVAFMLMPALKQYVVTPAVLYVLMTRRWRAIAVGVGVLAATIAPFLIFDWRPTVDGMLMRGATAFRPDSDSIAAFVNYLTGLVPPRWLAPAVQLAVGALAYFWLRRRGLAGLLLASALALFASFLLGPQAFVNYYYFVAALLVCSAVVSGPSVVTE